MNFNKIIISLLTATSIISGSPQIKNNSNNYIEQNKNVNITSTQTTDSSLSSSEEAYIHFISTGNSDSILIMTQNKVVLIDGGDNDDESYLVNFIKNKDIQKIDYLIATHPDADHVGALDKITDSFDIRQIFIGNSTSNSKTYKDFINSVANKGLHPSVPLEGTKIELDSSSYLQFFNTKGGSNANESSLVILFVNNNNKVLFMGDAGFETEKRILDSLPDVDLIKIGHHGSKNSTSNALLNKVKPEEAVITTGENNYGHPHQSILSKLNSYKITSHRTDLCGTITYTSSGNGLIPQCENSHRDNNDSTKQDTFNLEEKVVLSASGKKYHRDTCKYVKTIKAYLSIESAIAKGYSECKVCFE